MGYKSKLKQLRRQQQNNPGTNDWAKDLNIITVDANDNNWLFRLGSPFDSNAQLICQGSLDSCIDAANQEIPTLQIEREQMRKHCGEFGILDRGSWHIIYKPLSERDSEPWHQSDIDKFDAAIASVKIN
jgi:hypothetical protein